MAELIATGRPFIMIPREWNFDPLLNSVSWESEYLFRRIANTVDRHWRLQVDPEDIAFSVRALVFVSARRCAAWPVNKVATGLRELLAGGIVIREAYGPRCWLTVTERLRYEKGERPHEGPPAPAEQMEANLGPMLFDVPRPDPLGARQRVQKSNIPARREKKEIRSNESPQTTPHDPTAQPVQGIRAMGREGPRPAESGVFARNEIASDDPVWEDLCRFLKPNGEMMSEELWKNGANWAKCLQADRVALGAAVRECMEMDKRETIKNRGAALNDAWTRNRRASA